MAKTRGGVRASAESRRGSLRDWIVTDLSGGAGRTALRTMENSDWVAKPLVGESGAWIVTPDGIIWDTAAMEGNPEASTMRGSGDHDQALLALGRHQGWEDMVDLYGEAERRGYSTVRLWSMAFNSRKVIAIRLGRSYAIGDQFRAAKRILDRLSGLGINIYTAYGNPIRADIGYAGGYFDGTVEKFMGSRSWADANG